MKKIITILLLFTLFTGIHIASGDIEKRKLYLYDDIAIYPWSGFMGATYGSSITLNLYNKEKPYESTYCAQISTSGQESWCGIVIQSRPNQWTQPGSDFTGMISLHFSIKGAQGGEKVIIKCMNDKYTQNLVLTNQWKQYSQQLSINDDLSSITGLFTIVIADSQKISFFLDEIYFEAEQTQSSEISTLPDIIKGIGYNEINPLKYDADFSKIRNDMHANTLRFWGQLDITPVLLDKALEHKLAVILPFWMPFQVDYTDTHMRTALKRSVFNFLKFYLPHKSVIALSLGNEVFHNLAPATNENKKAFATLLDELCADIHTQYPLLKTTYAAVGLNPLSILTENTPNMDLYGCNAYGNLNQVVQEYITSSYKKPLIFLEFGCLGWWERNWPGYSNEQRAEDYIKHWNQLRNSTLGGCAFVWVDKTESGFSGWGIINNDRTLRPQFNVLSNAYGIPLTGDINNDDRINMTDFIIALKVIAGNELSNEVNLSTFDINNDNILGLKEVVYLFRTCVNNID